MDFVTPYSDKDRATLAIAGKVALAGGHRTRRSLSAPWVPHCDTPVTVYRTVKSGSHRVGLEVDMKVPCRRCAKCLQFRQLKWKERAEREILLAKRTWWITLTFSPTHLAGILAKAHSLPPHLSMDRRIDRVAYGHLQRFFKRLRKVGTFRFLAVFERGEEHGRAHYHLFIHETGDRPILKSSLETQWPSIVHARLVDEGRKGLTGYLTKYATKSFDIPPRASIRYGKN